MGDPPPLPGNTPTTPAGPPPVDAASFGPEQPPGQGVGLILGRFMPPHLGHQYLIDFASRYVGQLTVLIRGRSGDVIAGDQRVFWLREMFPEVAVILVTDDRAPPNGAEDTTFYNRWNHKIRQQVPAGLDFLFASERYGPRLAEMLGAKYVPVDPARVTVPISGTQVRADPLGHWEFLPPCVRPYYLRRVCVTGPASSGKTTLAANLARHFATCYAGEYAHVLRGLKRELEPADVQGIARAQLAAEMTLAARANRVLFLDTDLLTVRFWSERQFGLCPEWICRESERRAYDLYLVMDEDGPSTDERRLFRQHVLETLKARDLDYVRLSGPWDKRFEKAVAAVDALLRKK
jgi:NadR type nicotinamide-nucleotide adenylyltransferase